MRNVILLLVAALLVSAVGCTSMRETAQYIGDGMGAFDPEIDYELSGLKGAEERLARLFVPVDERIERLAETVSAVDAPPSREWYESFALSYPWVTGLAVLDENGLVVDRIPSQGLKPLPVSDIIAVEDWPRAGLRTFFLDTPLGPEVYFVKALTEEGRWLGTFVAHFDPASLKRYSPAPEKLAMFAPGLPLWSTPDAQTATELADQPWQETLEDDVEGEVDIGETSYVWLARAVGGRHILYAVTERAE